MQTQQNGNIQPNYSSTQIQQQFASTFIQPNNNFNYNSTTNQSQTHFYFPQQNTQSLNIG